MEIFRSDSSGKDYANERLFNLVKRVKENTLKNFFDNILIINDHKGILIIHLKNYDCDIDYIVAVFKVFWYLENEFLLEIVVNGKTIHS